MDHKFLSLEEAAKLRGVTADDIRRYVFEDRTLAAVLVDSAGWPTPFVHWGLRGYSVEADCVVFDLVNNRPAGNLRFEMAAVIHHLAAWAHEGAEVFPLSTSNDQPGSEAMNMPWLVADSRDPDPLQDWYTPARYFARQLVIEKPTLLNNRNLLARRVAVALFNAGFKKRGGKLGFNSGTVLKSFAKVTLG